MTASGFHTHRQLLLHTDVPLLHTEAEKKCDNVRLAYFFGVSTERSSFFRAKLQKRRKCHGFWLLGSQKNRMCDNVRGFLLQYAAMVFKKDKHTKIHVFHGHPTLTVPYSIAGARNYSAPRIQGSDLSQDVTRPNLAPAQFGWPNGSTIQHDSAPQGSLSSASHSSRPRCAMCEIRQLDTQKLFQNRQML